MKTSAIVPARCQIDAQGRVFAPDFGDVYHPQAGAFEQAQHVFLNGNALPGRWQGRSRFVVLETGFGLGNNFLATWEAWRRDERRCERLHFISVERHPPSRAELARLHVASALKPLADDLIAAWPPLTHNLHRLCFDAGRVQLSLALGDATAWLRELVAEVDAFFLDGFAPDRNPDMWRPELFAALARLAVPGATLATWTAARSVREKLAAAGFTARLGPGSGGKRDITLAEYTPRFVPVAPPARRRSRTPASTHALIVGAGLAGCAAASALAEQGWTCTVFDHHGGAAREASGNPAGMFHGIVNRHDGAHARFNRAAALQAERSVRLAIARHGVAGSADGMLRLAAVSDGLPAMQALLHEIGLPADYVQACSRAKVAALSGLPLARPAWFFPGGGWVDPAGLARAWIDAAGSAVQFRGDMSVQSLRRTATGWELLDRHGRLIDASETIVLCNAKDALRLLGNPAWKVSSVRGQISHWRADGSLALPRLPVSGGGYLLPLHGDHVVFGATSQPGDADATVRDVDHAENLARLATWYTDSAGRIRPEVLQGRTGWRMVANDRLPVIGAVPETGLVVGTRAFTQARWVPRQTGLFVFAALGSRGITWAGLGGRVLAAAVTGAPQALEASLLDAVDPARFECRRIRRNESAA